MKKIKNYLFAIIPVIFAVFLNFTFFIPGASAENCFNRNLLGDNDIFWGNPPPNNIYQPSPRTYPNVSASVGDIVRLSIEGEFPPGIGESGCGGMIAEFEIYRDGSYSSPVRLISGSLNPGSVIINGNLGTFQWYVDWPHDLFDGNYRFRVTRIGGQNINSVISGNVLIIAGVGTAPPLPTCSANFSPVSILQGQPSTLTWTSLDDADGTLPYSCTGSIGSGFTTADGSVLLTPAGSQACTFTVANGGGSSSCQASITVSQPPPPLASIFCNGTPNQCNVVYNGSATIDWTSTNATSCNVSPSGWTGITGSQNVTSLTSSRTYSITCTGAGGSVSANVQVNVGSAPGASCNTSFSPSSISTGGSTTQSWSSANDADGSLAYNCSGDLGSGTLSSGGSRTVSPTQTQSCTLTALNVAGTSATCVSNVIVTTPPPPPPNCNTNPLCTGSCSAPANTCSVNNGTRSNCTYTAYSGGGSCIQVSAPNQSCTVSNCSIGYSCSGGICVAPTPTPPPPPAPQSFSGWLVIPNPFGDQNDTFDDLFGSVYSFIYRLAAYIVVIMIILAGLIFLFGRGQPDKVQLAKKILTYAMVGLAIILIGTGFFTLLDSIFALGN